MSVFPNSQFLSSTWYQSECLRKPNCLHAFSICSGKDHLLIAVTIWCRLLPPSRPDRRSASHISNYLQNSHWHIKSVLCFPCNFVVYPFRLQLRHLSSSLPATSSPPWLPSLSETSLSVVATTTTPSSLKTANINDVVV